MSKKSPPKIEEPLPSIEQQVDDVKSITEATWNDLSDIGEAVDKTKGDTEAMKKVLQKLYKNQIYLESSIKQTIAEEVETQLKPLIEQLNTLTTDKPKFIYIKPKFPSLNIFKIMYNKIRNG